MSKLILYFLCGFLISDFENVEGFWALGQAEMEHIEALNRPPPQLSPPPPQPSPPPKQPVLPLRSLRRWQAKLRRRINLKSSPVESPSVDVFANIFRGVPK